MINPTHSSSLTPHEYGIFPNLILIWIISTLRLNFMEKMLRNRSTRRSVDQWLCCSDWNDFYPKSNLLWGPSIKLSSHDWYASKLVRHRTYRVSPLTQSVRGAPYQNVTLLKDRLLTYQDELGTSCITLPYPHFRLNSPTPYVSFHHDTNALCFSLISSTSVIWDCWKDDSTIFKMRPVFQQFDIYDLPILQFELWKSNIKSCHRCDWRNFKPIIQVCASLTEGNDL